MKRSLLFAVALSVAIAACSGDDSADPTTSSVLTVAPASPAPTTTIPTTTVPVTTVPVITAPATAVVTTAEPTTSPPTSTLPPTTVAIGETDWRLVLETLGRRRQEIYAAPDVSRVGEVCAADSECQVQLDAQIADMANKGWHVEGADPFTVLTATLEQFDGDTLEESLIVTVVGVVQRPENGGQVLDSSGAVVADVDAETSVGSNAQGRFLLARIGAPGDEWRIVRQEVLPEVPA
jgi:hypothetical protein